jgi:hypothetical protein
MRCQGAVIGEMGNLSVLRLEMIKAGDLRRPIKSVTGSSQIYVPRGVKAACCGLCWGNCKGGSSVNRLCSADIRDGGIVDLHPEERGVDQLWKPQRRRRHCADC